MSLPTVQLEALSLSQLVALYNAYAAKPVKKFSTKPEALIRVGKLADGRAVEVADDGTHLFEQVESAEQREVRLAGLSENEAADRDELPSFDGVDDSGAQAHVVPGVVAVVPASVVVAKRRGPPPAFADTDVISVNSKIENARRSPKAANWARYALYKDGMTVAEYLDAAVKLQGETATRWRGDLIWDANRGNITFYTARQWANAQAERDIEDDGAQD